MTTKVDIINRAYSLMRISGLTVQPTPEDYDLALYKLEDMAEEYYARNICVNYNFEDEPDTGSLTNMHRKFWHSFSACLARRLITDFGKIPSPTLIAESDAAFSFLSSVTAQVDQTQYPSRQPRGSGSMRYNRWNRYFQPAATAPNECKTHTMYIDDINDFVEHYDAYLNDGETISSYVLTVDDGLEVVSESLSSPDVNYRIKAAGTSSGGSIALLQAKIVVTTSDSRVNTRLINFELLQSDVID